MMKYQTINVKPETHLTLIEHMRGGESFDECITRLLKELDNFRGLNK